MKFRYEAQRSDGLRISGQIEARTMRTAQRDLAARRLNLIAINEVSARGKSGRGAKRRIRTRDTVYSLKELESLVSGGVPITEAAAALEASSDHPAIGAAFGNLHAALRRGEKFSRAFAANFPHFPTYIHRLIDSGEMTGRLAEALADAANQVEAEAKVRTELRNALVYPAFLIGFGFLAILFISLIVVPRFGTMFEGKFDKLPFISYVVIVGGLWFHDHILLSAILAICAGLGIFYAFRQPALRARTLGMLFRTPVIKDWLAEMETARWASVLARLLENRIPLLQSLELARTVLRNPDFQHRLSQVERSVRGGGGLAVAFDEHDFLPSTALSLIRVGEKSGKLAEMMRSVATIYDGIVRNRIKIVLTIIEPLAIILIGGVIGLMAVAIFLAITSINDVTGI
jgi:general secretion pathway protein F